MTTVVKDEHIQIEKLELGPFGTNAYILVCRQSGESVIVDAPANAAKHIQQAATSVIERHDEDGIAKFLRARFDLAI